MHKKCKTTRDKFMERRAKYIAKRKELAKQDGGDRKSGKIFKKNGKRVKRKQKYDEQIFEDEDFYYWPAYLKKHGDPRKNRALGHRVCRHPVNKRKGVIADSLGWTGRYTS